MNRRKVARPSVNTLVYDGAQTHTYQLIVDGYLCTYLIHRLGEYHTCWLPCCRRQLLTEFV